ncbi:MDR family MFS transporter [Acidisphaera sp. S103]|uniref:MDR family MFS transporter n=1 Tax=Acidisphaera sp. S103 TaxID=1747223 RepID=UPI00131DF6A4|nr:MDR family MFS transporter [Acidisphaera sp. S103]
MPDAPGESLSRTQPTMPEQPDKARRRLVLAACLIATFMAAVESTIVATIIPTIVSDLGGFNLFTWVFTVYLLTQAVAIPVYGRLADLYGRKPVFFAGTALFLIGTILCGSAWSMLSLVLFRAVQGCGAGAIQPIAATILGDIYTPAERGRIQGLVSSVFGVSAVIGPSLGAFLVAHVSWRVVFWVNVPIGIAAIIMIAVFLRESVQHRRHSIDWAGSLLLLLAFGSLMLALVQSGVLSGPTLAALTATGVIALVALYFHERSTPEPMLPLELWRIRVIIVGSLGNFTSGAMMMGVSAFLPTYVQGAMGRGAIDGGLVLGAMSVTWAFASIAAGRLMVRTSYRLVAIIGGLSLSTGCAMLVALSPADGPLWASAGSLVIGIGMGCCSTTFIVSIQASVPWGQRGAATSSSMFMRFVGQSVGASSCGAVLNVSMRHLDPGAVNAVAQLLDLPTRRAMAPDRLAHLTDVMAGSLHNAYLLATGFAVLTLVIACQLPARLSPTRH